MKTGYCLIKASTDLPYNRENQYISSSWGTILRYKKECVLTQYVGLAPVFRRLWELKPDAKGRVTLLTAEEEFSSLYKERFV